MAMDQTAANYTFAEIVEGTVNVIDRLPTAMPEWGMLAGFQPVSNPDNEKLHDHDNSHYAAGTAHYRLGVSGIADKARRNAANHSDPNRREFLYGIADVYDAVSRYFRRYGEVVAECSLGDERISAIDDNLTSLSCEPPRTFVQAVQLMYLI